MFSEHSSATGQKERGREEEGGDKGRGGGQGVREKLRHGGEKNI